MDIAFQTEAQRHVYGKVSAQIAKKFAHSEFEEYRITQDKLFESDFDKELKQLTSEMDNAKKEQ